MNNKALMRAATTCMLFLALSLQRDAVGYEILTHARMSNEAALQATNLTNNLANLGLSSLLHELTRDGSTKKALEWIEEGAIKEDDTISESFARYRHHFYDPISGMGFGGILFRNSGFMSGMPAPEWGLDKGPADGQLYSFRQGRQYFFDGLTKPSKAERDGHLALMFSTLGHVVHLVQDMAQPQHTRNDGHADGSAYERYTDEKRSDLPYTASGVTPPYFPNARDFFANDAGTGIAQFSNNHFVSAGTNFELYQGQQVAVSKYSLPRPGNAQDVLIQNLSPQFSQDILDYCGTSPGCRMTFYSTNDNSPAYNPKASSLSIFDQYVQLRPATYIDPATSTTYQLDRLFALNRYNFASAHPLLIPRAVAYSAGLLNYFFRGKLEISLPDEGVYGIVDHNQEAGNSKTTGGFGEIRLKLRNVTPGQDGVEPMSGTGKLRAVARFHRNTCYEPDLSGEYGSPGKDWNACRANVEEIVVSDEVTAPAGINDAAQPLRFVFQARVPISATDLHLQVVYRGPLGQEGDAVAVATQDISEPTYYYASDIHDQFTYPHYPLLGEEGSYTFPQWCEQGGYPTPEECNRNAFPATTKWRFSPTAAPVPGYDPANPTVPMGEWTDISAQPPLAPVAVLFAPTGSYARVAILTDAEPANAEVWVSEWHDSVKNHHSFQWLAGTAIATKNQLDPDSGTLTPSATYERARGAYFYAADAEWISTSIQVDPATLPPLMPSASLIQF